MKSTFEKTRKVYLAEPANRLDFWAVRTLAGGQTIDASRPPSDDASPYQSRFDPSHETCLQYAAHQPSGYIDLRIYPGADSQFIKYEDENDHYSRERAECTTFTLGWEDAKGTLIISEQNGNFPGVLRERTINVVLVHASSVLES